MKKANLVMGLESHLISLIVCFDKTVRIVFSPILDALEVFEKGLTYLYWKKVLNKCLKNYGHSG